MTIQHGGAYPIVAPLGCLSYRGCLPSRTRLSVIESPSTIYAL